MGCGSLRPPAQDVPVTPLDNNHNSMKITSNAFMHEGMIPSVYTCDGEGISPPLHISEIPTQAVSLVLFVDDPDIPQVVKERMNIEVFDHWVLYNIDVTQLSEVEIPENSHVGLMGVNTRGNQEYGPPCPPPEYEPSMHRYFFKVYALDAMLSISEGATKDQVASMISEHIVDEALLVGLYSRK